MRTLYAFPETLATHTLLTWLGVDPDDIYYGKVLDTDGKTVCMGVRVRPSTARGSAAWSGDEVRIACDLIGDEPTWVARFSADVTAWNQTTSSARYQHMIKSAAYQKRGALLLRLHEKGFTPTMPEGAKA